jgi:hypothetical protein
MISTTFKIEITGIHMLLTIPHLFYTGKIYSKLEEVVDCVLIIPYTPHIIPGISQNTSGIIQYLNQAYRTRARVLYAALDGNIINKISKVDNINCIDRIYLEIICHFSIDSS